MHHEPPHTNARPPTRTPLAPQPTTPAACASADPGDARTRIYAPNPQRPYFHHEDGSRLSYTEAVIDHAANEPAAVRALLTDGICELLDAGFTAVDDGDHTEAVRLFTAAGRLCGEARGLWPTSARRADP